MDSPLSGRRLLEGSETVYTSACASVRASRMERFSGTGPSTGRSDLQNSAPSARALGMSLSARARVSSGRRSRTDAARASALGSIPETAGSVRVCAGVGEPVSAARSGPVAGGAAGASVSALRAGVGVSSAVSGVAASAARGASPVPGTGAPLFSVGGAEVSRLSAVAGGSTVAGEDGLFRSGLVSLLGTGEDGLFRSGSVSLLGTGEGEPFRSGPASPSGSGSGRGRGAS